MSLSDLYRRRQRKHSRPLRCEALEDRRVLATFTVMTTADAGAGSLRQLLADADTNPGVDTILFDSSLDNSTISLTSSELTINGDTILDATTLSKLTIDASPLDLTPGTPDGRGERVFNVIGGDTEFRGLTIRGGDTLDSGGGIFTGASLILDDMHFIGNRAFSEGSAVAITIPQGENNVAVQVTNSTFTNNGNLRWNFGDGAKGGAISALFPVGSSDNSLTIADSTFSGNGTDFATGPSMFGGGLYAYGEGDVTITNSVFDGNASFEGSGGGAMISLTNGSTQISGSTFENNSAVRRASSTTSLFGGGLYAYSYNSNMSVLNSVITGNSVEGEAGGLGVYASGYSIVDLRYLEISYNHAMTQEQYGIGGGVSLSSVAGSNTTLSNSTISGNMSGGPGGGAHLYLAYDGSVMSVNNVTVAHNTAATGTGSNGGGGGLSVVAQPLYEVQLLNTIVAKNISSGVAEDVSGNVRAEFSLIENLGVAVISGSNNMFSVDPLLKPLADNGGPSRTHALNYDSPAIDAGFIFTSQGSDQRGDIRIADGDSDGSPVVDMGAFELQDNTPPVANVSLSQSSGGTGEDIVLNGTRSYDEDQDALNYQWSIVDQPQGSVATIVDPTAAITTWSGDLPGTYRVELVVSDGRADSPPVRFAVNLSQNAPPIANVSLSTNLGEVDNPINLNGTRSSDPEGMSLTYQWSIIEQPNGSNPIISSPTSGVTTWQTDTAGIYRVQLVVNDGTQDSNPVRFLTTVDPNSTPTANVSLSQSSGVVNSPINLNGSLSSDPNDTTLSYTWTIVDQPAGSNPIIANPIAPVTTWMSDVPGDYRIRLVVNNGVESSLPVQFLTTVNAATQPTANVSLSQNMGVVGMDLNLNGTRSSDPNQLPLDYLWSIVDQPTGSNVVIADHTAGATTLNADTAGDYRVRLVVSNGTESSLPVTFRVTISSNRLTASPFIGAPHNDSVIDSIFAQFGL